MMNETAKIFLDELKAECLKAVGLIQALEIEGLTEEQIDGLEGTLSASITYLKIRSATLEKIMGYEDDAE